MNENKQSLMTMYAETIELIERRGTEAMKGVYVQYQDMWHNLEEEYDYVLQMYDYLKKHNFSDSELVSLAGKLWLFTILYMMYEGGEYTRQITDNKN